MELTVVDWNLGHARPGRWTASEQAEYLLQVVKPHFALLQEVDRPAYDELRSRLGDRYRSCFSLDLGTPGDDRFSYGCAIFATDELIRPRRLRARAFKDFPEWLRDLTIVADVAQSNLKLASFHVPNAASRGWQNKRAFIEAVARMLKRQVRPTIVGIDANGPKQERFDPDQNMYWFHGTPEDRREELLHGKDAHGLRDVLRTYAEIRPDIASQLSRTGPDEPLRISHRRNGFPCRYDFIFATPEFEPESVCNPKSALDDGLSDHAPVVARLVLRHEPTESLD